MASLSSQTPAAALGRGQMFYIDCAHSTMGELREGNSGGSNSSSRSSTIKERRIIFIHLDLGIGGAEQLILNLALASKNGSNRNNSSMNTTSNNENGTLDDDVWIYTSHCDPSHCFDEVRKPHGSLCDNVTVYGAFIPPNIFGRGTAFFSTLRMMYITWKAIQDCKRHNKNHCKQTVFVLDVLPSSIPLIRRYLPQSAILFYCHFPDKLLTRDTVNGTIPSSSVEYTNTTAASYGLLFSQCMPKGIFSSLRYLYRWLFDRVEEYTMRYADLILVNSNFTKNEVGKVFPSLMQPIIVPSAEISSSSSSSSQEQRIELGSKIKVLYPAIDLNKFISPITTDVKQGQKDLKLYGPIVSLNRFERKKNIQMLIEAYAKLLQRIHSSTSRYITEEEEEEEELHPQRNRFVTYPPVLVIAGGYDPRNTENREYLEELKDACTKWNLHVDREVLFRPSVSDDDRATLLQSASCLCYTPHREHFGIVPLEAMYAGSPVIAVNSGGPRETVLHGVTGYLVENCSDSFCEALYDLIVLHPEKMDQFGMAGHVHITNQFGLLKFQSSWRALLNDCIQRSKLRCQTDRDSSFPYAFLVHWLLDLVIAFTLAFCARYILDSLDINVTNNFTRWVQ